ncbi:Flp family type IVb pilin [uncultured Thiodictyon sp.]|uniref:Flp family type IVb pilin n=1 Tax=uncultured Thiodictyon sp. TaxID=1846217 RepID=UPI0025F3F02D|nr:Flp family type IVb pilin [uncultured Thiodictyon sp.]
MKLMGVLKNFWCDEDGGESAEWPLILALVAVAAIAAYSLLGTNVKTAVNKIAASLT